MPTLPDNWRTTLRSIPTPSRTWLEPLLVPEPCSVSAVATCESTADPPDRFQGQSEQDPFPDHDRPTLYSRVTFEDVDSLMKTVDKLHTRKSHKGIIDKMLRNAPGRKESFRNKDSFLQSTVETRVRLGEIIRPATASASSQTQRDILDDMQLSPKRKKSIFRH